MSTTKLCITRSRPAIGSKFTIGLYLKGRQFSVTNPFWQNEHVANGEIKINHRTSDLTTNALQKLPPHSILPTSMLLRSLLVSTVLSSPFLLSPSLRLLQFLIQAQSSIFNVEKNPILHWILKKSFYEHFCAGENAQEVTRTIRNIKGMGFRGVILTYAREIVVDASTKDERGIGTQQLEENSVVTQEVHDSDIETWRKGVLETLSMLNEGDYLALKFTGAGASVTKSLTQKTQLPSQMTGALEEICAEAFANHIRILVDAEQQSVQSAIDRTALSLMQKFNRAGKAIIFNTYQAYLKSTPATVQSHLKAAADGDFTLGVKLVRGAYIKSEPRHLIHDTKADTDNCYDSIARALMEVDYTIIDPNNQLNTLATSVNLFVATHNKESALCAWNLQTERVATAKSIVPIQFGQLLGMADEVSCSLLQLKDSSTTTSSSPEVYKCLSWGTLGDCLSYLLRRAVENRDAVSRTKQEKAAIQTELWRRIASNFRLSRISS